MTISFGDTLRVAEPGTELDDHPWFVISDPALNEDVVIVNSTTWAAEKDQTCILETGAHHWITRKSCVYYFGAKMPKRKSLETLVSVRQLECGEPASDELLYRIIDGAFESEHTPMGVQELLEGQSLGG